MASESPALDGTWNETAPHAGAAALPDRGRIDAAILIGIASSLLMIGLLMTYSASASLKAPGESFPAGALVRQLAFVVAGIAVMLVVSYLPYTIWRWRPGRFLLQPSVLIFLATLGLLALVLVPGIGAVRNGARRWLQFGSIEFQPSELAKIATIILLSAWFSSRDRKPPVAAGFVSGVIPACLIIALAAGAVGIEDFGTAALIAGIGGILFFVAGARFRYLFMLAAPAAGALYYLIVSKPYRIERLTNFTRIWEDPLGKGYHQVQSLCTIASGGWLGRGIGQGIQKYGYLPEPRTDSIFAVICEELGMPARCWSSVVSRATLAGHRVMRNCTSPFAGCSRSASPSRSASKPP